MNRHHVAALACKVLGLWLFIEQIAHLSTIAFTVASLAPQVSSGPQAALLMLFLVLVQTGVPVVAGILLWRKADWLAARMLSAWQRAAPAIAISAEQVFVVAMAGLGVYLAALGIPGLLRALGTTATLRSNSDGLMFTSVGGGGRGWVALAQIVLGICLVRCARGVARWARVSPPRQPAEERPADACPVPAGAEPERAKAPSRIDGLWIATLVCRLLAFWPLLCGTLLIAELPAVFERVHPVSMLLLGAGAMVVASAILLLVGGVLWTRARSFAFRIAGRKQPIANAQTQLGVGPFVFTAVVMNLDAGLWVFAQPTMITKPGIPLCLSRGFWRQPSVYCWARH